MKARCVCVWGGGEGSGGELRLAPQKVTEQGTLLSMSTVGLMPRKKKGGGARGRGVGRGVCWHVSEYNVFRQVSSCDWKLSPETLY